jgi:hypothetical protein
LGSPRLRRCRCGVVLNPGREIFPLRDITFITRREHDTPYTDPTYICLHFALNRMGCRCSIRAEEYSATSIDQCIHPYPICMSMSCIYFQAHQVFKCYHSCMYEKADRRPLASPLSVPTYIRLGSSYVTYVPGCNCNGARTYHRRRPCHFS